MFLRHGARTPSSSQVAKSIAFLEAYKKFRGEQNENGIHEAKSILDEIEATYANGPFFSLSDLGASEMDSIAKRFKHRYPELFDAQLAKNDLVDVQSSDKSRSVDSAHSFIRGLYAQQNDVVEHVLNRLRLNNTMLRLFDECDQYMFGVKENFTAGDELIRF